MNINIIEEFVKSKYKNRIVVDNLSKSRWIVVGYAGFYQDNPSGFYVVSVYDKDIDAFFYIDEVLVTDCFMEGCHAS